MSIGGGVEPSLGVVLPSDGDLSNELVTTTLHTPRQLPGPVQN